MRRGSVSLVVMMVLYLLVAVAGVLLVTQSDGQAAANDAYDPQSVTVVSPGTPEEIERLLRGAQGEESTAQEELTEEMVEALLREQQAQQDGTAGETGAAQAASTDASQEAAESEETLQYYRFRTVGSQNQLNVRVAPQLDAEVTATLPWGATGYVLQRGEEWSEIVTDDTMVNGYCNNQYLSFTEVAETDFPEHIRREVRPSAVLPGEEEGNADEN